MSDALFLDARMRGFPPSEAAQSAAALIAGGFRPHDGRMALPLISLDRAAFANNTKLMLDYVAEQGVQIAPHAKTPMSPELAASLVAAGAWGATVADIRQAAVLLSAGHQRLILANEIGGANAARRLAAVAARHPKAELHLFVDSIAAVGAIASVWHEGLPKLGLLVELGLGRAGARDEAAGLAVLGAALEAENAALSVTGIAAYEGAAGVPDPAETLARINALLARLAGFLPLARGRIGDQRPLIVTAGGSLFFDLVLAALKPAVAADGNATILLRSGAIFFHDHGTYLRGLQDLDARQGFTIKGEARRAAEAFRPALRVWAEVLSLPEPGLAILGMGMRDVAIDQGLPIPLERFRDGAAIGPMEGAHVLRLNDQHAFVAIPPALDLAVGDVIAFGISHPCTCLDRHRLLYGLGPDLRVSAIYATQFG